MKYWKLAKPFQVSLVAPLVGAWIEMQVPALRYVVMPVAPLVGAWIEIVLVMTSVLNMVVAPLVGETSEKRVHH